MRPVMSVLDRVLVLMFLFTVLALSHGWSIQSETISPPPPVPTTSPAGDGGGGYTGG